MSTSQWVSKRVRILGRVQGVSFRESMRLEAIRLGASGWVRNRSDGSVEAFVQGKPEVVAALVAWAHRGPPAAQVEKVEEESETPDPQLQGFERKESF